jgi:hypothetical protein
MIHDRSLDSNMSIFNSHGYWYTGRQFSPLLGGSMDHSLVTNSMSRTITLYLFLAVIVFSKHVRFCWAYSLWLISSEHERFLC